MEKRCSYLSDVIIVLVEFGLGSQVCIDIGRLSNELVGSK